MRSCRSLVSVFVVGILALAVCAQAEECTGIIELPASSPYRATESYAEGLLTGVANALGVSQAGLAVTESIAGGSSVYLPERAVLIRYRVSTQAEMDAMHRYFGEAVRLVGGLMAELLGRTALAVELAAYGSGAGVGYFMWSPTELGDGAPGDFHAYGEEQRVIFSLLSTLALFIQSTIPGDSDYTHVGYIPGVGAYVDLYVSPYDLDPAVASWKCGDWLHVFVSSTQRMADLLAPLLAADESVYFSTDWVDDAATSYAYDQERFFFVAPARSLGETKTWTLYHQGED